jgi:hypothetical protein
MQPIFIEAAQSVSALHLHGWRRQSDHQSVAIREHRMSDDLEYLIAAMARHQAQHRQCSLAKELPVRQSQPVQRCWL